MERGLYVVFSVSSALNNAIPMLLHFYKSLNIFAELTAAQ